MNKNEIENFLVGTDVSIKEAMKIIDKGSLGVVFVVKKNNKIFGVVTDGDIRRAILNGVDVHDKIGDIANKTPITLKEGQEIGELNRKKDIQRGIPIMGSMKIPVVDKHGKIKDIIFIYKDGNNSLRRYSEKSKFLKNAVKKVLITGGAGYLGSVLCRKLLDSGYSVRVLDNLTYGDDGIKDLYKNPKFEFIKGDVRNISDVMDAVEKTDAVIHLSAIVGDGACQINSKQTVEINYLSAKAVAEACKFNQINKFLFASTCSVYGANKNSGGRLKEDSLLNPISLYAKSKLESEKGILSLIDENFSPTIFRFATLYGVSPRMRFDLVVNLMAASAVVKKEILIFGGKQWRPNLEVSDAAQACLKWVQSSIDKTGGEIFNVGSNSNNFQIFEIGNIIKKIFPGTKVINKNNETDIRDYNVSFDKISDVLDFKVKKNIEKGVLEVMALVEKNKIRDIDGPRYSNCRFLLEKGND